jgi:N-formylglutamate deformylase
MSDLAFTLQQGTRPLLLSLPHCGTHLPTEEQHRYAPRALACEDTDWHLAELYAFAVEIGASVIVPRASRYLIDLNRPPDDAPMYPGANNTELCPTRFFTGDPLYRPGAEPTPDEIAARRERWWRPYHEALAGELARLNAAHGHAVLFDGHSIKSALPWLFEGRLPDLNLGTAAGTSCAPSLREAMAAQLAAQARYTQVVDGRFKGGYITRHYGEPTRGLHAVQLEMTWRCYMDEATPSVWQPERAVEVQALLRALLQTAADWSPR